MTEALTPLVGETVTSTGQEIEGGAPSITMTEVEHIAVFPALSVAMHEELVEPIENRLDPESAQTTD